MEEIYLVEGETILWCGHEIPPHHFFSNVQRNDLKELPMFTDLINTHNGEKFRVRWVALCNRCIESRKNPLDGPLVTMEWNDISPIQIQNHWKN